MKHTLATLLLILSLCYCNSQKIKVTTGRWWTEICPVDTIRGTIYYCPTVSTHGTIEEGYFIAACGGYQIGNFYMSDAPTFIPAYFIRNDAMVNGKRQVNDYRRQRNSGLFTDLHFKPIPFDAIYGMVVARHFKNKP